MHKSCVPPSFTDDLAPGDFFQGDPPLPSFLIHSPELPKGMTRKLAIDLVARTPWAKDPAEGLARAECLTPDAVFFQEFVATFVEKVATAHRTKR